MSIETWILRSQKITFILLPFFCPKVPGVSAPRSDHITFSPKLDQSYAVTVFNSTFAAKLRPILTVLTTIPKKNIEHSNKSIFFKVSTEEDCLYLGP